MRFSNPPLEFATKCHEREREFFQEHERKFPWVNLEPRGETFEDRYRSSIRPQHRLNPRLRGEFP
jgi:hypothetical protein